MITSTLKPLASALSIAALLYSAAASAVVLNTATESEFFGMSFSPRTFSIKNQLGVLLENTVDPSASSQQVLSFDKFDSALGNLLSVTMGVRFSDSRMASITAAMGTSGLVEFTSRGDVDLLLTGPGFIQDLTTHRDVDVSCSIDGSDPDTPQECFQGVASIPVLNSVGLVEGALANFIGTGTFDITARITGVLNPETSPAAGPIFFDNSSMSGRLEAAWKGSVDLFYTYETRDEPPGVPEPVTLCLLGAGLGAAVLAGRRKRRVQGSTR